MCPKRPRPCTPPSPESPNKSGPWRTNWGSRCLRVTASAWCPTEPGKAVIAIAERILAEAQNLRRAGEEYANDQAGTLTIAATHTQARYALPKAVAAFKRRYPKVELVIHQGNPTQICDQVLAGEADMGVATEMISLYPELVSLPVYQWNRCVVVPPKHPLLRQNPLTLEK